MANQDLYLSPVDLTLNLCSTIYGMAATAKAKKKNCQQVAVRVKALEALVHTAGQRQLGVISEPVEDALKELRCTLEYAKRLMEKFSRANIFRRWWWRSRRSEDKFSGVDERLTDNFQLLSGALLIDQRNTAHQRYAAAGESQRHTDPTAPMGFNPTAAMGLNPTAAMGLNPTAAMPQSKTMAPMWSNSTASMAQPNTMDPMMSNSTAAMPQPNTMDPMWSNSTDAMAQPNTMDPMMSNSTDAMAQPNTMDPMMSNSTDAMAQPNTMDPMMSNSTAAMPQPNTMAFMGFNPTAAMPQSKTTPPMRSNSTDAMLQPNTMAPMSAFNTRTPAPAGWARPSMAMSNSIPFSTHTVPNCDMSMMPPIFLNKN